jgi:hypothetical protein
MEKNSKHFLSKIESVFITDGDCMLLYLNVSTGLS